MSDKLDSLINKFQSFKEELNKNVNESYAAPANGDMAMSEGKGIHVSSNPDEPGRSEMGIMTRLGENEKAKDEAKQTLKEMKKLPKPKLVKEEGEMDKAEIIDMKSKKTLAKLPTDKPSKPAAVGGGDKEGGLIVPTKLKNIKNIERQHPEAKGLHADVVEGRKAWKVAKSINAEEQISFNDHGQWSLEKSVYNAGTHPPKGRNPMRPMSDVGSFDSYDSKKSYKENREAARAHHSNHPIKIKNEAHLDAITTAAAKRSGLSAAAISDAKAKNS